MKKKYGEIFLLPSLFSLANAFFGFLSIVLTLHEKYTAAAVWIIMAALMDAFDGIVARSTRTQSDFGAQLDSLADSFSFGAAPSILFYRWGLHAAGTVGMFFSFIYLTAGILRLARYNILQKSSIDRRHYVGLTIPSASMFMSSVIIFLRYPLQTRQEALLFALLMLFISFCMISRIQYRNFLSFSFRQRIDLRTALLLAVLISSLIFFPRIFLVFFFSLNVLSGPTVLAFNVLKKKRKKKPAKEKVHS